MLNNKRIFLIHGWEGNPNNCWFPWLKLEMEKRGCEVIAPAMPHPEKPTIEDWVDCIRKNIGVPDDQTFFVGHSIGCQAIMRYLQTLNNVKIGGIVLVAGFFILRNLENEEVEAIAKPWVETPIDFNAIKKCADNINVILSDNDDYVPLEENKRMFELNLGAKVFIEHDLGHFDDEQGIKELPKILELLK
ncbi:MAG: alpha/beta hydrolase [Parcubacteria group bacterium]